MEITVNTKHILRQALKFEVEEVDYACLRNQPLNTLVFTTREGEMIQAKVVEHDWKKDVQGENVKLETPYGFMVFRPGKDYRKVYMEKEPTN